MRQKAGQLIPVAPTAVEIRDHFWAPRLRVNRRIALFHQYRMLERTGHLEALRLAWKPGDPNPPHIFWESDTAKWLEAACLSLATHTDAKLQGLVDQVIALLAGAQGKDGYLNAHFTVVEPGKRFTNLRDNHELYCAGHLMEAGVAHFQATGDSTLLNVVRRYADYIDSTFGPGPDQRRGYPGHEEIELALVKLYRATREARYLHLAKFFLDQRGQTPNFFIAEAKTRGETTAPSFAPAYYQAHIPVRRQKEAVGHAVRAMYLYAGMADVAAETGDVALHAACQRLWANVTTCKMYVTGGIGARHEGEAFGENYELPNLTAYAETCAAIGLVLLAHRMIRLEPISQYADVLERALYNGVLAGVSCDGREYFYVNPLASLGRHHRQPWYGCACCPPNLARLLAGLGGYIYSVAPGALYVHLFIGGSARLELDGQRVQFTQETRYPYAGTVDFTIRTARPAHFVLCLRLPDWCRGDYGLAINGRQTRPAAHQGYLHLERTWSDGDQVRLDLPMPVERMVADPRVADAANCVALQRGPLVYCLEQADHDVDIHTLRLSDRAKIRARTDARRLGGTVVLEGSAYSQRHAALYAPLGRPSKVRSTHFRAVPYHLWDNRQPGAMRVWLPRAF